MTKKAVEKDNQTQWDLDSLIDQPSPPSETDDTNPTAPDSETPEESPSASDEILEPESEPDPSYFASRDFTIAFGRHTFSQRKGDIITDQQRILIYKKTNAPIELFDAQMMAKCPNPKCGCVFAWDGGQKKEA